MEKCHTIPQGYQEPTNVESLVVVKILNKMLSMSIVLDWVVLMMSIVIEKLIELQVMNKSNSIDLCQNTFPFRFLN